MIVQCVACDGDGEPCPYCGGDDATCKHCSGLGKPCQVCGGEGEIEVPCCPYTLLDRRTIDLLRYAGYAIDGTWPCGGGLGDQTQWFIDAVQYVRAERSRCESELTPEGGGG